MVCVKAVDIPYDQEILAQREVWDRKPILRRIYHGYFEKILEQLTDGGPTIEIGAGGGFFSEWLAQKGGDAGLVSTDVFQTPWVDLMADAHFLPIRDGALRNLIGQDVLHQLTDPLRFFREVVRVLAPGGRLVLIEPHISAWGYLLYRFLHHEACVLSDDPWGPRPEVEDFNWANGALPWLCLSKHRSRFEAEFPQLKLARLECFDSIAYPASGGFNYASYLFAPLLRCLLWCERLIPQFVRKHLLGIRCLIVLERQ